MKKIDIFKGLMIMAAVSAIAAGCAKENEKSSNELNREYLEAWIAVNHPEARLHGMGVYILDEETGTGESVTDEDLYLFADKTTADLDGNISGTTDENLAKQVGTYKESNFYGPQVIVNLHGLTSAGIVEIIKGMRIGGTRTALIPGWLNVTDDYDSAEKYFKKGDGSNAIVTITLSDKTKDITKWEIDSLERYTALNMGDVDSVFTGYYYQQLKAPDDTTTLPKDTSFYINYIGRLLNGQVFDTTIEDTAKFYGIYSTSKSYGPMYATMNEDISKITISSGESEEGSTTITGFAYCMSKLKLREKGVCAFMSTLGYGYSGSGSSIPPFSPLSFEIEMVDKPEE